MFTALALVLIVGFSTILILSGSIPLLWLFGLSKEMIIGMSIIIVLMSFVLYLMYSLRHGDKHAKIIERGY